MSFAAVQGRLVRWWRGIFPRRYRLAAPFDRGPRRGPTVVLLHGIANNHKAWDFVHPHIRSRCRVVALDLLGFGDSPAPQDIGYTVQDHADAVIYTLRKLRLKRNVILVGHSMGALIAVEVARRQPQLFRQLILCSMPVYRTDKLLGILPRQDAAYVALYNFIMQRQEFTIKTFEQVRRLAGKLAPGFGLTETQWYPFKQSLANTIIGQTTHEDLSGLSVPVRLLVGRLDIFIIQRHLARLARRHDNITLVKLYEPHDVGENFARYVAEEIDAAVEGRPVDAGRVRRVLPIKPVLNSNRLRR
ncbi:alpha/beta fold hydrolase [Candidatus Saccharibacteria bacterium]|nr:alpha/beta fold hydrolase [Candidatus Saccharibacteria bacterium]